MDTEDEQCRDVYAYFGLAIYAAQCLEQAIIQCLLMMDHFPKAVPGYTTQEYWAAQHDAFYEKEESRTMGQLIGRFQKIGIPSEEIEEKLQSSLKKRNWLAHSYFSERAMEFMSEAGRKSMIEELEEARDHFHDVDKELMKITLDIAEGYGMTEEVFSEIMEQMLSEANADL
ncbi:MULTISPECIES: hypothetical protein [Aeromonas]|jgi:hypothetical protein|nr:MULTISPECIES: hypothetical protein [Aeromonas]MBS4713001.1 hypothetical protein [Aeromonas caviae]